VIHNLIKRIRIRLMKKYNVPASYMQGVPLYAQGREDVYLLRLFGRNYKGFYVDVGANNGVLVSNTYSLYRLGWRGICLEPNPDAYAELKRVRGEDVCLNVGAGSEPGSLQLTWKTGLTEGSTLQAVAADGRRSATVEVKPLTDILRASNVPTKFDVLSIDVEGVEIEVMKGLDWNTYRPHLIILEYNSGGKLNTEAVDFAMALGYRAIVINRWNVILSNDWENDILRTHIGQDWFQFDRAIL